MKTPSLKTRPALAFAAAFALLLPVVAQAFCGLQSCPRVDPHSVAHPFEAGARTRLVAFDIANETGVYGVISPRFFARVRGLSLGVEAPWVTLAAGTERASGLGNPLFMTQYSARVTHAWSAEAGLQIELPLGDADRGLADDHTMILPWIGARKQWGTAWYTSGMLGYSQAVESGASHDEDPADTLSARVYGLAKAMHEGHEHGEDGAAAKPLYVNPHGDREIHWRAAAGWLPAERWTLEGFALGQADLSESKTEFYARAGASASFALTESLELQVNADAPVTANRRNELSLGADVKIGW